ncbi:unnamed protein product [Lota lota]
MSGFHYRGRHSADGRRDRPKSTGPLTDISCAEMERSPPVQMQSLREFEQHLNDLKKENFSLKLRIYFLEERIQQKYEESSGDVFKRDIELKVEVESLKKDLEEKQQLLDKTLSTVESLSNQNEAELQQRLAERQEEISHMQEILQTKVQLLQEEAELARGEAERMTSLADSESQRCLDLEREVAIKTEECRGLLLQCSQRGSAHPDRKGVKRGHRASYKIEEYTEGTPLFAGGRVPVITVVLEQQGDALTRNTIRFLRSGHPNHSVSKIDVTAMRVDTAGDHSVGRHCLIEEVQS